MTDLGRLRKVAARQAPAGDCGPAAIATVLRYHGVSVSVSRMQDLCGNHPSGASLADLCRACRYFGARADALEATYNELLTLSPPYVVHLSGDSFGQHYVVMCRCDQDGVVLWDPARGQVALDARAFRRGWATHLLVRIEAPSRRMHGRPSA